MAVLKYTHDQMLTFSEPSRSPNPFLSLAGQNAVENGCATTLIRAFDAPEREGESSSASATASASNSEESDSPSTPATSRCGSPGKYLPSAACPDVKSSIKRPVTPLCSYGLLRDAQHQSLQEKLINQAMVDRVTGDRYSSIANNGIYVFLDTSNIEISFRNAVKDRMGVDRSVILEPAPFLDMEFLTQILVRDRKVNVKNAGCSHRPDRPLPVVVKQLRKLGYQVDVRERKLLLDDPVSPIKRGYRSSRGSAPNDNAHYVEDLVDETLQTRIYESVMEDFANPGTLVLATGDGKAAKFSDGFFACANRALKMGWNVEVISWQTSLSSVWTDPTWTRHWGDRFRLIRLDWFMDELYPSLEARART